MDDKTKYVWKMWGKWYGYPDCCVDALCKGEQKRGGYFTGTGFVPCIKCYDRNPEDVVAHIKVNRWSSEGLLDWSVRSYDNKEELVFIENFWRCMGDSYDRGKPN